LFSGDKTLAGQERIEYGHLLGGPHRWRYRRIFREANVLAAGDAISPLKILCLTGFGGGWLGGAPMRRKNLEASR